MSCYCLTQIRAKAKFSLAELGRTRQHPGEDLDMYVRRLHERALDYYDLVAGEVLVEVCLHSMMEEYSLFLESLSFSFISKLMEATRCTNESVRRT